ncbi:hypothetical protein [Roseobacter sp. HKCCA0434]|uniref:hypothetical protein n=1 Tax=Roseobacter sp. HKCCA0434 TaxID=3079297 RepID=UPI002905EE82|nr:hypothetical protein [Roseobacter sp. HKCCA0434]
MIRLALLALLLTAACAPEIDVVELPAPPPEPEVEPRVRFTDDNIPYDLTAGADITAIPPDWIQVFCLQEWESRAEPYTGIEQWNPCKRPDMFNDGPRTEPAPEPAVVELDDLRDVLGAQVTTNEPLQADPLPVVVQPTAAQPEFDLAPNPDLFMNRDGSFSRRQR